jgi:DNA-binding NarL/FixJ family response regulator
MIPPLPHRAAEPASVPATVRIVLIEDHLLVRDGLRALLAQESAAVQVLGEAGTAREGYVWVQKTRPDLVVLDLNLPDQSGARLAAEIRSSFPQTKILILSGNSSPSAAAEAAAAGADGFVRKEDAAREFLRAIPVIMAGRSYFSPVAADALAQAHWKKSEIKKAPTAPELAERELEVLRGFAEGFSYKEIASQLQISVRTAETYRARLVRKLGCSSRAELVRFAIRQGLVQP